MLDQKLQTFLTVAERRSYTLAAQALHITQPAVSQHIRKLEEHYGVQLIDFTGHQLSLTQSGELLYRYAAFQSANEKRLLEQLSKQAQTLRVGATLSIADYYLPPLLVPVLARGFQSLILRVGNTEEMLDSCVRGELDCALIEGIFHDEDFCSHVFHTASFLPVAAANHPLAQGEHRLAELFHYPLILREPGSGTRAILENQLFQFGSSPQAFAGLLECGSFRMIKELLKQTSAISFMYEQVAAQEVEAGELTYLTLTDCQIRRPLYFVYPRHSMSQSACQSFYHDCLCPGTVQGPAR